MLFSKRYRRQTDWNDPRVIETFRIGKWDVDIYEMDTSKFLPADPILSPTQRYARQGTVLLKGNSKKVARAVQAAQAILEASECDKETEATTMKKPQIELTDKPQNVTMELRDYYTPEHFEVWNGRLLHDDDAREKLLLLMIHQVGIKRTLELIEKHRKRKDDNA